MTDGTVYMVACRSCAALQQVETVATEWRDGEPVAWEHRCANCDHPFGFVLDGGELDLGLVKESITTDINDFEVFTEEPWK